MGDYTEKSYNRIASSCGINPGEDVLDWDNQIPIPPARPCGTIRVRLKPAEPPKLFPMPEDDIPLTSLDDLK